MPPPTKPNLPLDPSTLFDAIIIGAGPAGLSAALALCRMNRRAVIFSNNEYRNARATHAHTILSRDHESAASIRAVARTQIEAYGTTRFVERGVVSATATVIATRDAQDDDTAARGFEVRDAAGETWRARKLILATGVKDILPTAIEGYAECWGTAIWQCLFCDGIERADKHAGVLGFSRPMDLHNVLFPFQFGCPGVTVFLNGVGKEEMDEATAEALEVARAKGARIEERRIERLVLLEDGEGMDVVLEGGETTRIGFLVHQPRTEVAAPQLAKELGVEILSDGRGGTLLKRNEPFGESNVAGVFVAGDTGTLMKQFTFAMAHGVTAGAGVAFQLGQEEEGAIKKRLEKEKHSRVAGSM